MQVPYTNTKDRPVSIAGKRINPGETRSVEETMIPGFRRQGAEAPEPADPILAILDDSVKNIVPKLESLSVEDFDKLRQAEADGKTRKSLIAAFEEEALRRAEEKAKADEKAKAEGGDAKNEGGAGAGESTTNEGGAGTGEGSGEGSTNQGGDDSGEGSANDGGDDGRKTEEGE